MIKAFKVIPFNKSKEEIPLKSQLFYVDVQENPNYWEDVVVITSKDLEGLSEIHANMQALKDHPKFKNKFVIINHYKTDEDKIDYMLLEELKGAVDNPVNTASPPSSQGYKDPDDNEIEF